MTGFRAYVLWGSLFALHSSPGCGGGTVPPPSSLGRYTFEATIPADADSVRFRLYRSGRIVYEEPSARVFRDGDRVRFIYRGPKSYEYLGVFVVFPGQELVATPANEVVVWR